MEAIVERIVEKCIQSELIEESQRDWMAYSLQRKFMNFGGFFILVCFGTLVAPLPQVILLNFGLALLREKTNGLHTSHSAARNARITGSLQMKLFGLSMPAAAMRWCCSRPIARWQR